MQPTPMNESSDVEDTVIDIPADEVPGSANKIDKDLTVSAQAELLRQIANLIAHDLRKPFQ